ncbi:hypothetical protein KBB27_01760 [Patescibacteria group bacterium]|nr:hypothetical protein [Patescibacteria group bacterium]
MRPVLREALQGYQDVARHRAVALQTASNKRDKMEHVREYALEVVAERTHVDRAHQEEIFDLQQEKEGIMEVLREDMRRIEQGFGLQELYESSIPVTWKDGQLIARWSEKEIPLTIGQMIGDLGWGLHYRLDPLSVPKRIQKRYALERAREELWKRADEQVAIFEDQNPANEEKYRGVFRRQIKNLERKKENLGFIAERMTYSLLKRIEHDIASYQREQGGEICVEFSARHADVHQDVYQKMDFIIALPEWLRGAKVLVEEGSREEYSSGIVQGFQLTTNDQMIAEKTEQIDVVKKQLKKEDRIRDIAVILLQYDAVYRAFHTWKAYGCPPGGPCEQLTKEEVKEITQKLFRNLFSENSMNVLEDFIEDRVALVRPPADAIMPSHEDFEKGAFAKRKEASPLREFSRRAEKVEVLFRTTQFFHLKRYWDPNDVDAFLNELIATEDEAARFMNERGVWEARIVEESAQQASEKRWAEIGMKLASLKARIAVTKSFKQRLEKIQSYTITECKGVFETLQGKDVHKKIRFVVQNMCYSPNDARIPVWTEEVNTVLEQPTQTYLSAASTRWASDSEIRVKESLNAAVACCAARIISERLSQQKRQAA